MGATRRIGFHGTIDRNGLRRIDHAFGRAGDAVAATITGQRRLQAEVWPAPLSLRVRMGVHTREVEERDGEYFGTPLNRTARIITTSSDSARHSSTASRA